MRTIAALTCFSLIGLVGARAACGQEGREAASLPRFEVTPFLGYRFGGNFDIEGSGENAHANDHLAYGVAFSVRLDDVSQYGLFYSRESTTTDSNSGVGRLDLDVEYLHLDGTLSAEEPSRLNPYVIGSLGVTRFSVNTGGASDDTRFSIALGGGLRIPVRARVDMRLEARAYVTFVDSNSSVFCASGSSGGVCALRGSASTFVQYELLAGAAFAF